MNLNTEKQLKIKGRLIFNLLVFIICAIAIIAYQSIIRKSMDYAIKLCLSSIIPAIFPFMILSDYASHSFTIQNDGKIANYFRKLFSINGIGVIPFFIGNICGFPLGAQIAKRLYNIRYINQEEYERLLPLCSNPSLAFVISGVGCGMRGSISEGVMLYVVTIASTIISGIIWKADCSASDFKGNLGNNVFSLSSSIKSSAKSCIYVSAYVTFFSIIVGWIEHINLPQWISLLIVSFLEIGNASSLISEKVVNQHISLSLTAFTLGFSGISVYMQSLCFSPEGVQNKYYVKIKLTEGAIAFILTYVLSFFI